MLWLLLQEQACFVALPTFVVARDGDVGLPESAKRTMGSYYIFLLRDLRTMSKVTYYIFSISLTAGLYQMILIHPNNVLKL